MTKVMILNGPNMNMLGVREPDIYGHETLEDIEKMCRGRAIELGFEIDFRQSNNEGQLVDWIQEAYRQEFSAVIINAAAYTHTSLAIHDALKLLACPIIELHISDPKKREAFRHISYVEFVATHSICGQGAQGYVLALEKLKEVL